MTEQYDKGRAEHKSPDETRRRLLRASAAVPLVATAMPNAALAQSSLTSITQCAVPLDSKIAKRKTVDGYQLKQNPANPDLPSRLYEVGVNLYKAGDDSSHKNGLYEANKADYVRARFKVVELYDIDTLSGAPQYTGFYPVTEYNHFHATPLNGSCMTSFSRKQ